MSGPVGPVSSIPSRVTPSLSEPQTQWGGDTGPTGLAQIRDPVLRAAVLRAYRAWAKEQK